MLHGSQTKFRTTKSVQIATTRNYVERKRLGQTIVQYQKDCREAINDLREKRDTFLKTKYPRITSRQTSLHLMASRSTNFHRSSRYDSYSDVIKSKSLKAHLLKSSSKKKDAGREKTSTEENNVNTTVKRASLSLPEVRESNWKLKHSEKNGASAKDVRKLPRLDENSTKFSATHMKTKTDPSRRIKIHVDLKHAEYPKRTRYS